MAAFSLRVVAAISGYHVHKESWEPSIGDLVTFQRHTGELLRCRVKQEILNKMPFSTITPPFACTLVEQLPLSHAVSTAGVNMTRRVQQVLVQLFVHRKRFKLQKQRTKKVTSQQNTITMTANWKKDGNQKMSKFVRELEETGTFYQNEKWKDKKQRLQCEVPFPTQNNWRTTAVASGACVTEPPYQKSPTVPLNLLHESLNSSHPRVITHTSCH